MLTLTDLRRLAARSGARDISKVEIDVILTHLPGPTGGEQPWVRTLHRRRETREARPIAVVLSLFG